MEVFWKWVCSAQPGSTYNSINKPVTVLLRVEAEVNSLSVFVVVRSDTLWFTLVVAGDSGDRWSGVVDTSEMFKFDHHRLPHMWLVRNKYRYFQVQTSSTNARPFKSKGSGRKAYFEASYFVSYWRLVIQEMAVSRFISIAIFPAHLLMVFSDTVE